MGAMLGHEDWLFDHDVIGAGSLEAHDVPGVFNVVLRARDEEGSVSISRDHAAQEGPGAMIRSGAPAPSPAQHEAALGHFRLGANRVVGTADQGVGVLGVDFFLRRLRHQRDLESVHAYDAARPGRTHVRLCDQNLLPEEVLRLALKAPPLLRKQHGEKP